MVDVNLSGVEGEILAGGVVKIKQVALADTRLTTGQVNKLAKKILDEERLILEELYISNVNLGGVEIEILAASSSRSRKSISRIHNSLRGSSTSLPGGSRMRRS